jgi:predicted amidophosphoribosyltransferase
MESVSAQTGGCTCPGCGAPIPCADIACRRCRRRLPRELRHALVLAERVRHRDHQPYLDALRAARQWWAEHRERC